MQILSLILKNDGKNPIQNQNIRLGMIYGLTGDDTIIYQREMQGSLPLKKSQIDPFHHFIYVKKLKKSKSEKKLLLQQKIRIVATLLKISSTILSN